MGKKAWSTALSVAMCAILLPYIVHSNDVDAAYEADDNCSNFNTSIVPVSAKYLCVARVHTGFRLKLYNNI